MMSSTFSGDPPTPADVSDQSHGEEQRAFGDGSTEQGRRVRSAADGSVIGRGTSCSRKRSSCPAANLL